MFYIEEPQKNNPILEGIYFFICLFILIAGIYGLQVIGLFGGGKCQ